MRDYTVVDDGMLWVWIAWEYVGEVWQCEKVCYYYLVYDQIVRCHLKEGGGGGVVWEKRRG